MARPTDPTLLFRVKLAKALLLIELWRVTASARCLELPDSGPIPPSQKKKMCDRYLSEPNRACFPLCIDEEQSRLDGEMRGHLAGFRLICAVVVGSR
jgi:hypothetical protein